MIESTGAGPEPGAVSGDRLEVVSPVAGISPGYFALVMATGIIAIGAELEQVGWLADALFAVAAVAFVVLGGLALLRFVIYPRRVLADLFSHARGFSFLTIVAAANVLGSACGLVHGWWTLAWALWWVSLVLWAPLVYAALIPIVVKSPKPGMGTGINGTWFLLTVSVESMAALGALLLDRHPSDLLAFACLATFGLGLILYLIVMTMVFLRWTFQELSPTEADPPAWIAAGAVAITVLAGSNLLLATTTSPRLERLAPFLEGLVITCWATATFWFPLMIAIGVWRHLVRRMPLRYNPAYWAMVFPLGMYGVATFKMGLAIDLDALGWLPKVALGLALLAWTLAFVGLVWEGVSAVQRRLAT